MGNKKSNPKNRGQLHALQEQIEEIESKQVNDFVEDSKDT